MKPWSKQYFNKIFFIVSLIDLFSYFQNKK